MFTQLWVALLAWLAPRWVALTVKLVPPLIVCGLLLYIWHSGGLGAKVAALLLVINVAAVVFDLVGHRVTPIAKN